MELEGPRQSSASLFCCEFALEQQTVTLGSGWRLVRDHELMEHTATEGTVLAERLRYLTSLLEGECKRYRGARSIIRLLNMP